MKVYAWQKETEAQAAKVPANVVSGQAHRLGMQLNEPLIVGMDALIRYARAYEKRFEQELADDNFLGPAWLEAAKGFRALLNGDGAVAWELGRTTDSKDNGAVESMFWDALNLAGFGENDL